MIEITAISLDGGTSHEHITHLEWQSAASSGLASREALIEWLNERSENQAVVAGEGEHVPVLVVEPHEREPFIRTFADGVWTDHLFRLPRF